MIFPKNLIVKNPIKIDKSRYYGTPLKIIDPNMLVKEWLKIDKYGFDYKIVIKNKWNNRKLERMLKVKDEDNKKKLKI